MEVAEAVGEELRKDGSEVEVRQFGEVGEVESYQAVVVGAPMIIGWHREAVKFIKKHQQALSRVPVAYFMMAMSLTSKAEPDLNSLTIIVDPELPKGPKVPGKLSLRERSTTLGHYLKPVLRAAPKVKPVSVAFFGGKLDYGKLKLLQMLFVMLVVQAAPGDRRNWTAIREWAEGLSKIWG